MPRAVLLGVSIKNAPEIEHLSALLITFKITVEFSPPI